jgi:hypothetical protein
MPPNDGKPTNGSKALLASPAFRVGVALIAATTIFAAGTQMHKFLGITYMPRDEIRREFVTHAEHERMCRELRDAIRETHDELGAQLDRLLDRQDDVMDKIIQFHSGGP